MLGHLAIIDIAVAIGIQCAHVRNAVLRIRRERIRLGKRRAEGADAEKALPRPGW
jgi:hypothetical protein